MTGDVRETVQQMMAERMKLAMQERINRAFGMTNQRETAREEDTLTVDKLRAAINKVRRVNEAQLIGPPTTIIVSRPSWCVTFKPTNNRVNYRAKYMPRSWCGWVQAGPPDGFALNIGTALVMNERTHALYRRMVVPEER